MSVSAALQGLSAIILLRPRVFAAGTGFSGGELGDQNRCCNKLHECAGMQSSSDNALAL